MLYKIFTLLLQINLVRPLDVYWNIPSFMCRRYINITGLHSLYGIRQNEADSFRGSVISIMYENGDFPELRQNKSEIFIFKNGGVPQEGNLTAHLIKFEEQVNIQIPDQCYSGLVIIDFETWRPVFRQNFGFLEIYKTFSINLEKEKQPLWNQAQIEVEASRRFEDSARAFVEETVRVARQLRPKASWGYYAFPYCFNNNGQDFCSKETMAENERSSWIFKHANMILPSVYLSERLTSEGRQNLVRGRVKEAIRLSNIVDQLPVYVYIRYVYIDSLKLLTKTDLENVFEIAEDQGAKGIILWGSSNDLKSNKSCMEFEKYVREVLGPVAKSSQNSRILNENLLCTFVAAFLVLKSKVFENSV